MDFEVSFGLWLKRRRKALDLTQAALAQRVGCSVATIEKIESDERRPSRQIAELLADMLEIPLADRATFVKVARGERRVDRLPPPPLPAAPLLGQARPAPRSNLPAPPTPLIGREAEMTALGALLRDPQCRLVTLVGPGGIGKTRLAIESAAAHRDAFADGVYFVPLAPLSSPEFIVPATAAALGFSFYGPTDPRTQLLNYLREKEMLLVLDNVEHLLAEGPLQGNGVELLAEILQYAPSLKLQVTSRERLNLMGEWVFELQGLPVPPADQVERVDEYSAVALFVQSARRAQAGLVLRAEERPAVARICRLVEGMPLAIELAAVWVRVLSCAEIAREIERDLDFLAASVRNLPERHRSLHAVFDHSWRLLSTEERGVMGKLSVFRGGFTREAAEQVAGASLALLSALEAKSLAHRTEKDRYELHSLVRQYAEHKLIQADGTRQAHSDYYLAFLQQHQHQLRSAKLFEARDTLATEAANIREAWRWVVQHNDFRRIRESARSLIDMYDWLYWYPEGEQMFVEAVQVLQAQSPAAAARIERSEYARALGAALLGKDVFTFRMGQPHPARDLLFESLELFQEVGDIEAQADNLEWLGNMVYKQGDYTAAIRVLRQGLVLHEKRNDLWGQAVTLNLLAVATLLKGQYSEAQRLLEEALAKFRSCGNPIMVIIVLINLGRAFRLQNEYDRARVLTEESFALSQTIGDRWSIGTSLDFLGQLALERGHYDEARREFEQALKEFRDIGDSWSRLRILINLGRTEQALGNLSAAQQIFLEALRLAQQARFVPRMFEALVGLAVVWTQTGWQERAIEALVSVRIHSMTPQETRDQAERLYAELETHLTPEQIKDVQTRAKTFEAVVAAVLEAG